MEDKRILWKNEFVIWLLVRLRTRQRDQVGEDIQKRTDAGARGPFTGWPAKNGWWWWLWWWSYLSLAWKFNFKICAFVQILSRTGASEWSIVWCGRITFSTLGLLNGCFTIYAWYIMLLVCNLIYIMPLNFYIPWNF